MFESLKPPAVPTELLEAFAAETYGLSGTWKRLLGERDQNFRISDGAGERWVLKVCSPHEGLGVIECQTAALEHISRTDSTLSVPRVRRTATNDPVAQLTYESQIYPVIVLSYLDGETFGDTQPTTHQLFELGQIVARLGRSLRGFVHAAPAQRDLLWDHRQAHKLVDHLSLLPPDRADKAKQILTDFATDTMPKLERLRTQVIHGDVHPNNTLIANGEITGIIDFGDIVQGTLAQDVANLIADFLQPGADNHRTMFELVSGYQSITPLEEEEIDVLLPLLRVRLLMTPLISRLRKGLGADEPSYSDGGDRAFLLLDELSPSGESGNAGESTQSVESLERELRRAATFPPKRFPQEKSIDELMVQRRALMGSKPYVFYDKPLHMVSGQGVWLTASDGRKYMDCYNNVPHVGHCHPYVIEATARQARILNTNTRYLTDQSLEYAQRLTATLDPSLTSVVFVNSGSEANDIAWRMAKAWTQHSGGLAMEFAYHGVTEAIDMFSPSNWMDTWNAPHIRLLPAPDDYRGPFKRGEADLADRYAALADAPIAELATSNLGVAAAMVDSAFITNGMIEAPVGYLQKIVEKIRSAGGLFIADEVQSGFGRMGTAMWGHQHHGIVPDFVTIGKPAGNGHPLGVVITRPEILDHFTKTAPFFSTFGGNNVSCAAGLAVLDVLENERLIENSHRMGAYFKSLLTDLMSKHQLIGDVRGTGLAIGVELVRDRSTLEPAPEEAKKLINFVRDEGILIGTEGIHGNILKIRPPIILTRDNAEFAALAIDRALQKLN